MKIKVNLRKFEPYLQQADASKNYLKWYLFKKKHLNKKKHSSWEFVNKPRTDGGASQILGIWSILDFANFIGAKFNYNEISNVEHDYLNSGSLHKSWSDNFVKDMLSLTSNININLSNYQHISSNWDINTQINKYQLDHALDFWRRYPDRFQCWSELMRERYWGKKLLSKKDIEPKIIVHMRRGDVDKNDTIRYSPDEYFFEMILKAKKIYQNYDIEIITNEINPTKLKEIKSYGLVHNNLEIDVFEAIKKIATSAVFIASKSSLSTLGAMLSRGIVFYQPFSQPASPNWLRVGQRFGKIHVKEMRKCV